jgi:hypothetical protein
MTMKKDKIFVSIASYKDSELLNTLNDLYENAKNPDDIRCVVLNQTNYDESNDFKLFFNDKKIEIYSVDYRHTKGVCWVRHKIQSFIEDEDYYLQIDSHMRFDKDWDEKFKNYLNECNSLKPVITFYPSAYSIEDGKKQFNIIKNEIRGLNRQACSSLGISMNKALCDLQNGDNKPIPGTTIAAGFLFASIDYAKEVPYDPNLFWNYEESDQTYRGFTHGWDFFGLPECLIWHKYNTTGVMTHYKENPNSMHRENFSNSYAEKKLFQPDYDGLYKLGNVRTLEEFEILNNISFKDKIFEKPKDKDILIVVPYRDREEHLKDFLEKTPKYFNERNISYDILITELDDIGDWNAGLVCNSLINFKKKSNYKYLYIHHVDIYPINGEWVYPKDNEMFFNMGDYGSCLMKMDDFLKVGGYRNGFWGWGSEDNDLNAKFSKSGIKVTDVTELSNYSVVYDTKHQDHQRKFEAVNYSNSHRILFTPHSRNTDSVFDFNKYGKTHSLKKIGESIYKHNVTPLKSSPKNVKNKNVILAYIKNLKVDYIYPFIKSVSYFASYNYDMCIIDASTEENPTLVREIEQFGFKVIKRNATYENLFIDRLVAFKEFGLSNDYEKILCLDFSDIVLQKNPFDILETLPQDNLILTSEGVVIGDQKWNRNVINMVYGENVLNVVSPYEVLNCGVTYGTPQVMSDFADVVVNEYEKQTDSVKKIYGVDQAIILKLIYHDQKIKVHAIRDELPLAVHLHVYVNDKDKCRFKDINIIGNKVVTNKNNEKFSIVHQYNRNLEMFNDILRYYKSFYQPPS